MMNESDFRHELKRAEYRLDLETRLYKRLLEELNKSERLNSRLLNIITYMAYGFIFAFFLAVYAIQSIAK